MSDQPLRPTPLLRLITDLGDALPLLRLISDLGDAFKQAWEAGSPQRLEDCLNSAPEEARAELFRELLNIECDFRKRQGRPLAADEAHQRFAALGDWAPAILAERGLEADPPGLVLRVVEGPHAGESFRLSGRNRMLVGRGDEANLALDRDGKVSRFHCWLEFNPPRARLTDVSKHGTRLNGQPIKEADLRDGDRIEISKTVLQVSLPSTPGPVTITTTDAFPTIDSPPTPLMAGPLPPHPVQGVPGYVLERELGAGGMGVVSQARREKDQAVVALKMILPALQHRPDLSAKFLREMQIVAQLQHPNIVRWLDSGDTGHMLFFAMEFVAGPSASQVVKESGPLAPERVVALGCQLLDALGFAHEKGFVHRDVKPANLLLTTSNGVEQLKLADFGLAKEYQDSGLSGLTLTGTAGGTAAFMPPEQVTDFRSARPTADQYGAAATLYNLLTGQHIYEKSNSMLELLGRILTHEPIPLREPCEGPTLPGRLGAVLRRALARDPARRYPDIRDMRQELSRAL